MLIGDPSSMQLMQKQIMIVINSKFEQPLYIGLAGELVKALTFLKQKTEKT